MLVTTGIAMTALGLYETRQLQSQSETICVDTAKPPVCEPVGADPNAILAAEEIITVGAAATIIGAAALVSASTLDKSMIIWSSRRKFDVQKELLLTGRDNELVEPEIDIVDRFED
jgi:hypothetical protein